MQILIFLALFSFSNAEVNCLSDKKLSFSPEVLKYYFSKTGEPRVLPLSQGSCTVSSGSIDIYDYQKRKVGTFNVAKTIRSKFNDIVRYQKKLPTELKSMYKSLELSKDVNPYKFLNFLFTFNNDESLDFGQEITFVVGRMTQLKSDLANFSHYRSDEDHWAAKSIDYKEAINFLSEGAKVGFIHIKDEGPYHLPVLSNFTTYVSFNNVFKYKYLDVVDQSRLNLEIKKKPMVIFSKALQYHQAYNTITNLYLEGYRNIYWYHKSFMKWQAKYKYMEKKFYVDWKNALSNAQAEKLLLQNKDLEILDLSKPDVFNQVRFQKAKIGQVVFYDTEAMEPYLGNINNSPGEKRRATSGTYNILNAKELFPRPSTILIVTFNHYLNEYKAKEVFRRLEKQGHKVFILRTSTGVFLDYLRSKNSPLVKSIYEEKKTSEVFSWKS